MSFVIVGRKTIPRTVWCYFWVGISGSALIGGRFPLVAVFCLLFVLRTIPFFLSAHRELPSTLIFRSRRIRMWNGSTNHFRCGWMMSTMRGINGILSCICMPWVVDLTLLGCSAVSFLFKLKFCTSILAIWKVWLNDLLTTETWKRVSS